MAWEQSLLQGFRAGQSDALAHVYREHAGALLRTLRAASFRGGPFALLRSPLELENAVIEVFARAFEPRARAVYDGVRPYEHFLMGIAKRYLLELLRLRERASGVGLASDGELEALLGGTEDWERTYEDREVQRLLQSFLDELGPAERMLYRLRFDDELTQDEAARQLGLTRIQARRREFALKKKLLIYLKARGYLRDMSTRGWSFLRWRRVKS